MTADYRTCELCGLEVECALHHIFFGSANRRLSDKWGMTAWLCPACHDLVHANARLPFGDTYNLILKQRYQRKFEQEHPEVDFVAIFGRNYLD